MSRTFKQKHSGSKRFDGSCRNHGSCQYCVKQRTYFDKKYRQQADDDIKYYRVKYF